MRRKPGRCAWLAITLVGLLSLGVVAAPSFSDNDTDAGNLNPTDTIQVQEIHITRSSSDDVTLSAVTIRNLGTAATEDIEKIEVRNGGILLGESDSLGGLDETSGTIITLGLGGYYMATTATDVKIVVTVGTSIEGGETLELQVRFDYVDDSVSGTSAWITDLSPETIQNGGFDEIDDSSDDASFLNPGDTKVVQQAVYTDNDANTSPVEWRGAGTTPVVTIENLGTAQTSDIFEITVTLRFGGDDYIATGPWNNDIVTFQYQNFSLDGLGVTFLPAQIADNGAITVTVEMEIDPTVGDNRTIRTKTTLFVEERGEDQDLADPSPEYDQAITASTTQTIRDQGFEIIEEESDPLASGSAATGDVVIQEVRATDDDSNALAVNTTHIYIRNAGSADGDEIQKIQVKAGGTTLLTLNGGPGGDLDDFRTGAWYLLTNPRNVNDDDDQLFRIEYTIGVPDDGHTLRPIIQLRGEEGGTPYDSDEVEYPDTLDLYLPGFEFIENLTPPEGGVASSAARVLVQVIRVEDRDENDDDVTIDPIVVFNDGNADAGEVTKVEVWRADTRDGVQSKMGEETDMTGFRTGGVRVDIDTNNIVVDDDEGAEAFLFVYLTIADPEIITEGHTVQLETRVIHVEDQQSFDKMATSNQWTLEVNNRPVPDFTVDVVANGAADAGLHIGPMADYEFSYLDELQFTGTATDPDGDAIEAWLWDFDDGSTSDEQNPTHEFPTGGLFEVTLTVTDARGVSGSVTKTLDVEGPPNTPPTITTINANPENPATNATVQFSADIEDPDQPTGDAFDYDWDFGDGTTSQSASPNHQFTEKGSYTVTLTVTDARDDSATKTRTISVGNEPPVVSGLSADPTTIEIGESTTITATATDPDPDDIELWLVDFADGLGEQEIDQGSSLSVQRQYTEPGTYVITVTAVDARDGTSAPVTVSVEVTRPDNVVYYGYPNPAVTQASFLYYLPDGAESVTMSIYSAMTGARVFEATLPVGQVTYSWDLTTVSGAQVGNGLYLCVIRVTNGDGSTTRSDVYKLIVSR